MKKITSLVLVIVLLLTSTITYGTIADKLSGHWANSLINRSFVAYYFPYLAKDNFSRFHPNEIISEQDFTLSLLSLFMDYSYSFSGVGENGNLSRQDMVRILGSKLIEIGLNNEENIEIPFKDINTMSSDSIELLRLLYNNKILIGDSSLSLSPNRNLTQVEAIIILQRVKEVLEKMNTVTFKTLGIVQSYNSQEELIINEEDEKVIVTITKQFPTPGYSMSIKKIMKENKGYKIFFDITPPKPDLMQPQVITYKTLTVELEKHLLNSPPYNFTLDGFNSVISN